MFSMQVNDLMDCTLSILRAGNASAKSCDSARVRFAGPQRLGQFAHAGRCGSARRVVAVDYSEARLAAEFRIIDMDPAHFSFVG